MNTVVARKRGRPTDPDLPARRREEILDAAVRLFSERGYSDTDTQILADRLKIGKGTLYRYFPSKRELFLAAVDRVIRRMREVVDASMVGIDDPLDRIAHAIRAYLCFYADNPPYVELLIQERALFKDRKKPTYFEYRDANIERWHAVYRALIAEGRVRPIPVERITDTLGDLVYGTMFTNYFAGQRKPSAEQARDILDVVFHGILSDCERSRRKSD
jgi:AcrR family transcriptional regulator